MKLLRAIYRRVDAHEVMGRGAQVAFYFLIAVFPLLLAAVGVLGALHLDREIGTLEFFVERGLPPAVAQLLLGELHNLQARTGWPLLFTLILSAYYGGSAVSSVLVGVTKAFAVERRMSLLQLHGVGIAGLVVLFVPVLLMVIAAVSWVVLWGSSHGYIPAPIAELVALSRWPLMVLLFQQLVNTLYRMSDAPGLPWGWFSWGSTFATLAWLAVTLGFEAYVKTVANLGATYGSLGTVVGLLFYAHTIAVCVLIGCEIDAERVSAREQSR